MRRNKRIAFVTDYLESEYSQKLCRGAGLCAAEREVELVAFSINQIRSKAYPYDYQALSVVSHLRPENFDGVLFATAAQLANSTTDYLSSFVKSFAPLPVVSIGNTLPGIPSVISTAEKGFSCVVSHLIEKHGCRRIALMSAHANSTDVEERSKIFKEILLSHNIAYDESMVLYGGFSYEIAYKALSAYNDVKGRIDFDAIVAMNDQMAYGCLDFFRQHNLRVPDDILVTGFDDDERSILMTPSLTSLNQELTTQGYKSMEMILSIIDGKPVESPIKVSVSPLYRQSCGCISKDSGRFLSLDENGNTIEDTTQQNFTIAGDWCTKKAQFTQVIQLYTQMQSDMTFEELRQHINSDLMSLGILSAAVVLFENPISTDPFEYFQLPNKAFLFSALDRYSGFWLSEQEEPIPFNPRESMIPEGIFASLDKMQVCALYHTTTIFGYLIFLPGKYDMTVYSMVCKMFSTALSTAYRLFQSEEEKKILKHEYNIATKISVTDEMTGLLNRRGFMDFGQKALELSQASGRFGMVVFGDIDGLKKINDTYGHASGDVAIKTEAALLKKTFRKTDIIGRLGGDEFAIIAPGMSEKKLTALREKLEELCKEWSKTTDEKFTLSISLGSIPYTPKDSLNLESLLEQADELLYKEKQLKHSAR